jgi:hypothetical protein
MQPGGSKRPSKYGGTLQLLFVLTAVVAVFSLLQVSWECRRQAAAVCPERS